MFDRCWLWRRRLTCRADGTLPLPQWGALAKHLLNCPHCQKAEQADRALRDASGYSYSAYSSLGGDPARRFDDRVVAALDLAGPRTPRLSVRQISLNTIFASAFNRSFTRGIELLPGQKSVRGSGLAPLAFFTQLASGAFAAATITSICLLASLHPGSAPKTIRANVQSALHNEPPVPLESLLRIRSPRAAQLYAPPTRTPSALLNATQPGNAVPQPKLPRRPTGSFDRHNRSDRRIADLLG